MKVLVGLFLSLGLVFALATSAFADEKKETKLEGTITCAKCDLKKADKCHTVIKVKGKDGKEIVYWFDAEGGEKYHKEICNEAKDGTVKGTVKKDGDKMVITVSEVKFK